MKILLCLAPAAWLLWLAKSGGLGANPVQQAQFFTGDWSLNFLLLTLVVTPFRRLTGWGKAAAWRRPFGLAAFFYALAHFGVYLALDQAFDLAGVLADVSKRRWITAGMGSLALMAPLALTSTDGMIRRLGRNWGRLHRLAYVCAALGVLHYFLLVKKDRTVPVRYAAVLAVLLGYRAAVALRPAPSQPAAADPA